MKTIICSVGTSSAKTLREKDLETWVVQNGGPEKAANLIYREFADAPPEGDALKSRLSAEIHSLVRIGLFEGDRVYLLTSETPDGHACGLAVEKYLNSNWPETRTDVNKVPGLQVHDSHRFQREGVVNFVQGCFDIISQCGPDNASLNPTGGFKALVPYMVLIGMLRGVPCHYIFEQSTTLLRLPPFPVEPKRSLFERHRDVFLALKEGTLSRTEFNKNVFGEDRPLIESLAYLDSNQMVLSDIGEVFIKEMEAPATLVPYLSKKAWTEFIEDLRPLVQCDPFAFIESVARDRAKLEKTTHVNQGNGMRWLKPGNTTDRYLVSVEAGKLLVWRGIREDQAGRNYPSEVVVNPQKDRSKHAPFTRMEFVE